MTEGADDEPRDDRLDDRPEHGGILGLRRCFCRGLKLAAEVLDLVAEPGGHLELQLGRGGVHLLGELPDQRDQVAAGGPAAGLK